MSQWAQAMSEQYLAEDIKQYPQDIWDLFPGALELREDIDLKIQAGEILASEAEELLRTNIEHAKREWVSRASRELVQYIVSFETGQNLEEMVEQIRQGDKKTALLLADTVDPEPGTPEYKAMTKIKQLYKDDATFLSALNQTLENAREKEKPAARRQSRGGEILSTRRLVEIFFWIKFNEDWLREEHVDHEAFSEALADRFGDDGDLPRPESLRRMLQFLGLERP